MNSRTLLNLGMVLAVAVLATVALLEPGKAPPPKEAPITDLAAGEVTRIGIERPGETPVELQKGGGRWRLTAPRDLPANPVRAGLIARAGEALTRGTLPAEGLERYGLAEPKVTLRLNDREIAFGDIDPLHQRRYLLTGGEVKLADDTLYPLLNRGWASFVDLAPLPEGSRIEGIELPGLTLAADGSGGWRVEPDRPNRSADAVVKLLDAWKRARAMEVSAYPRGAEAGEPVSLRLAGAADPLPFRIVEREPYLILARPDLGLLYRMADGGTALLALEPEPEPAIGAEASEAEVPAD